MIDSLEDFACLGNANKRYCYCLDCLTYLGYRSGYLQYLEKAISMLEDFFFSCKQHTERLAS